MKLTIITFVALTVIALVAFAQNKVKSDSSITKNKPEHKFIWTKSKTSDTIPMYDPPINSNKKDIVPILDNNKK